jgi:two-component system, sporulation sensor kinase E
MTSGFLEKLLARLDRVAPEDVQNYLLRLVREKGFFERVFEALEEGVIICDDAGHISFINRAACRFFGADAETAVGKMLGEVVRGLDWAAMAQGRRAAFSRDLEIFYPENRYLNFYLSPIEDVDDPKAPPPGYVLLLRDITQSRKLTEEMIESERMNALTLLAAGVAHEVGNPLNSLNIHLQLLERKLKKADKTIYQKVQSEVEVARGEVQRLHFIIEQFLGAIRPTKPNFELTDLNKVVESAVSFLAPEIKDRRIQTRLQLNTDIPLLRLDANQLKQTFYNLIKNACQAMGSGGKLLIRTEMTDYEVTILFQDNGKGMSPDTVSHLFEPYFTTKKTGTGLGMLIVRRIVREHGGELAIASEEGVGTTVTIHLPRGHRSLRFLGPSDEEMNAEAEPTVIDV